MRVVCLIVAVSARLACTDAKTGQRLLLADADKPYWDYRTEKGLYLTQRRSRYASWTDSELADMQSSLECRSVAEPADVVCAECETAGFAVQFLDRCQEATAETFNRIQEEVVRDGGNCLVGSTYSFKRPLEQCSSPQAACIVGSDADWAAAEAKAAAALDKAEAEIVSLQQRSAAAARLFTPVPAHKSIVARTLAQPPADGKPALPLDVTAQIAAAAGGPLLACTDELSGDRWLIAREDQAYWDYRAEKGLYFTQRRFAQMWTAEQLQKMRSRLACHAVEVPGTFACDTCVSNGFKLGFLSRCAAATEATFAEVQAGVLAEGGNCLVGGTYSFGRSVATCQSRPFEDEVDVAGCGVDSPAKAEEKLQRAEDQRRSAALDAEQQLERHAALRRLFARAGPAQAALTQLVQSRRVVRSDGLE